MLKLVLCRCATFPVLFVLKKPLDDTKREVLKRTDIDVAAIADGPCNHMRMPLYTIVGIGIASASASCACAGGNSLRASVWCTTALCHPRIMAPMAWCWHNRLRPVGGVLCSRVAWVITACAEAV